MIRLKYYIFFYVKIQWYMHILFTVAKYFHCNLVNSPIVICRIMEYNVYKLFLNFLIIKEVINHGKRL